MKENKLQTITNLFEGNAIRSIWDAEQEYYCFSVVDVIGDQNASDYWTTLKRRLKNDKKSEITDKNTLNYQYVDETKQIETR